MLFKWCNQDIVEHQFDERIVEVWQVMDIISSSAELIDGSYYSSFRHANVTMPNNKYIV